MEPVNPYIAGSPVTGAEMFFGRQDVFAFILQALVGKHRDNVIVLYGQRRTGKTSALYQMPRRLDARYVCVFIDLHGLALEGLDGFLWELANSIMRGLRRDYRVELPPLARDAFHANPRHAFENEFLPQVWSALGERHLLLMLDEAIRLQEQVQARKLEPETFAYLRYLMQHHERLNFLFALGKGLESMTQEYASLFSVGLYKKISFLGRDAALALITQPVQEFYRVADAARERILQITSGHPYYTQLLCHSIFNRWQHTRAAEIDAADVEAVVEETVERGLAVLKHVWEESAPAEKALLAGAAAAMGGAPGSNQPVTPDAIAHALKQQNIVVPSAERTQAYKSLLARDVLSGGEHFCFAVDLQRIWICKYARPEWIRDEIAAAVRQWSVSPPPPPRLLSPEYPTARPPTRRIPARALWLGSVALVGLGALAFLLLPRWFSPPPVLVAVQPTATNAAPTEISTQAQTQSAPTSLPPTAAPDGRFTASPERRFTETPLPSSPTRATPTDLPKPTAVFGAGVKIVFTRGDPGCSTIGLYDLDTKKSVTFKPAPNNEEPSWSPDGAHFVASTGDCGNKEYRLTIFDAATGESRRLDTNCDKSIDPYWGKDDRIYFVCGPRNDNGELFSINPDGSDLRALGLSARRPTLSPNANYLAYMRQADNVWRIWVAELDDTGALKNLRQLPFPQVLGGVYARQPKWNSDGTRLFFNITDQTSLQAIALASVELATNRTNVSFITADTNTPFVRPVCGKNNVCVAGSANGGLWLLEDADGALIPHRQLTFGEEYGADVFP
ncbi:MAG: hypothetical protein HY741_20490 [Chloroflexi bacterium]|nr:hypothetical protein [Chloroflexota bacterium]